MKRDRFTRPLSTGQANGMKALVYFLWKLKVKHGYKAVTFKLREYGQPGYRNTYEVHMLRDNEDS